MVDELRQPTRTYGTLSESSRSDESEHSLDRNIRNESSDDSSSQLRNSNIRKSRKQIPTELRERLECNPELYGIRRSGRSRKEPSRFEPPKVNDLDRRPRNRRRISSNSSSSESSDGSFHARLYKSKTSRYSCRTRGNRVDYKKAFNESESDEEKIPPPLRRKRTNFEVNTPLSTSRNQTLFQKRKGSLIRPSIKASDRGNAVEGSRQVDTSDADSLPYSQKGRLSDSDDEEESPLESSRRQSELIEGDEEVDVIEEVLTHALRRIGATGNPTTLYNCRMEQDPNEGFDPSLEKGEIQYFIKWRSWSHLHSTWETEASLTGPERGCVVDGLKRLHSYKAFIIEREEREKFAEKDELDALVYEDERNALILSDKMDIDRIVAHSRDKEQCSFDYLIKWRRLDYRYCTWESGVVINHLFKNAVDAYNKRCKSTTQPNSKHPALHTRPKFVRVSFQPEYLGAGDTNLKLRDYQLKGLNWITHAWTRGNSVILADEMGLGKTVQVVSFLSYLFHEHRIYGPFLIVVPLSTICSWQSELEVWGPQLNAITYTGDHISRQLIREHEWSSSSANLGRRQQILKFNVCLTTYEILLKDKSWLGQVSWAVLAVDEAHRLKNDASQLYKSLFAFNTNMRLLITGTPLQNSLKELWSLLHFLMPNKFPFWEEFESNYSLQSQNTRLNSEGYEVIRNLHRLLEPFLLRRVKKDVEQSLPAKTEKILRVEMSKKQTTIYRLILARNYEGLLKVTRGHRASFVNIVMELKKCCNHSYLIAPPDESDGIKDCPNQLLELLEGSGKLMLLDKLLLKLKPKGHRVLIFSQMVRMLDIVADYLRLRNWSFQRLDGSIRGELRKQSLDHFNSEGSTDFCFLLSTRAGGLGINLATADTVVIFDSDWNPQNDIQAQARAHRIGQTKQVSVYRLVVKDSVEEKIIECATRKMLLDHLVIQRMETTGSKLNGRRTDSKGQFLTEILRHGAEGLFKPNDDEKEVEVDIDDILNCAETRDVDVSDDVNNPANALLSTFNVVTLDQLEHDEANPVQMEQAGRSAVGKTWSEIIPTDLREQAMSEENKQSIIDLDLGPRRRKQVKAYQAGLDNYENLTSSSESDHTTDDKGSCKFSDKEVRALVRAVKRFARPLERIDAIAAEAELPDRTSNEVREIVDAVIKGCKSALENSNGPHLEDSAETNAKNRGPFFYYGKVAVAAKPLLQSINELEILYKCLPALSKDDRLNYELPFTPKSVNWSNPWDAKDDVRLLVGVYEHGYDNWEAIKLDSDLGLGSKILPPSSVDRPQSNHIRTRVDYLLKFLTKSVQISPSEANSNKPSKPKMKNAVESALDSSTRKNSKRTADARPTDSSRVNEHKPKSAEFVESDDSTSDSGNDPELSASSKLEKSKLHHRESKRLKHDTNVTLETNKKTKRKISVKESEPLHFTAQREPVSISKEEEDEFHQMRGPLFAECKNKLYPVKKQLKQLECLEDDDMTDSEQYDRAIMRIGDHISSLTSVLVHRHERHSWRGFYWEFVQNFSKKGTSELQHMYRSAIKREKKLQEKEKNNKGDDSEHTNKFSNSGEIKGHHLSDVPNNNINSRLQKHDHDLEKSSRFRQQSENHSVNLDSHEPPSSNSQGRDTDNRSSSRHDNWSRDRHRHRRMDSRPNNSGNFHFDRKYDRFDNAFNRPPPNLNSHPYSTPPLFLRPPPFSNHDQLISPAMPLQSSWSNFPNAYPPVSLPAMLPTSSIIPPPILPPNSNPSQNLPFSRDPRLANSNRP